jgi:Tfp pilus assembly protein PilZ
MSYKMKNTYKVSIRKPQGRRPNFKLGSNMSVLRCVLDYEINLRIAGHVAWIHIVCAPKIKNR